MNRGWTPCRRPGWTRGRRPAGHRAGSGRRRELWSRAGLTQKEVVVRNFEQERRGPTWERGVRRAHALGVDPNAFTKKPTTEAAAPKGRGRPQKETTHKASA